MDTQRKLVLIKNNEYGRLYNQYVTYRQTYNVSIINKMIADIRYMLYKESILLKNEIAAYALVYYILGNSEPDPTRWDLSKSNSSIVSMIKINLDTLESKNKIEVIPQ